MSMRAMHCCTCELRLSMSSRCDGGADLWSPLVAMDTTHVPLVVMDTAHVQVTYERAGLFCEM